MSELTENVATENVTPEIVPNIYHARCLSDRPWESRMVPYPNIGALLAERATSTPNKNWLTYCDDSGRVAETTYGDFYESARRVAGFLQGVLGLKAGDRI